MKTVSFLNVNIKFFFEPAEEKDGGAKFFVEDGLMENPKVEYMFGAHVQGYLDTKVIESKYGTLNASTNSISRPWSISAKRSRCISCSSADNNITTKHN